ncbi:sulfotransferase family 2 domain-containing protein [Agarilytica rhodophyticola]|uniref:sulfotransferase family 2 domain-containing protein n=1 Tax=Agarilytica rhodophyticola TaxID=1737490 RepID=UPI000B349750|nr:sulfotransferase family 2 domain-containing protein [Agarilytica rhodophyticola]
MLITPDFVFVHLPKTGGTFVTKILHEIYGEKAIEYGRKHATCDEIPEHELTKPILSVFRSPFDRYVSQYHYGWWKTHPEEYCKIDKVVEKYPHYPEISFYDFVHIANDFFTNTHQGKENGYINTKLSNEDKMGWHTEQFVRFFCHKSRQAFADIDEIQLKKGKHLKDEYSVHFLHTDRLNSDLADFLVQFDIDETILNNVLVHKPVLPNEAFELREKSDAFSYFNEDLKNFVTQREQFLFHRFPQYMNLS